jgi:hypothetical protein
MTSILLSVLLSLYSRQQSAEASSHGASEVCTRGNYIHVCWRISGMFSYTVEFRKYSAGFLMPTLGYDAEIRRAVVIALLTWEVTSFILRVQNVHSVTIYAQNYSMSWPKFCMRFSFSPCVSVPHTNTRRNMLFLYAGDLLALAGYQSGERPFTRHLFATAYANTSQPPSMLPFTPWRHGEKGLSMGDTRNAYRIF